MSQRVLPIIALVLAGFAFLLVLWIPPWVLPPIRAAETGPAAGEMMQFRAVSREVKYTLPKPLPPVDDDGGPRASAVYENVQVLGNLSQAEFSRLMLAITEWVSPKQGCSYCHKPTESFATDSLYTKTVARQMLRMVRHVNTEWAEHVAPSGITCFTCHRGENIPTQTWYDQEEPGSNQFIGKPRPWHLEAKTIRQFFPAVPYKHYLADDPKTAKIQSHDPLVAPDGTPQVAKEQTAEDLYLFMMQMSEALGVNCTYCHNSRAFFDWSQSTPYRWIGYWGIHMVRDINTKYIKPLKSVFPAERRGPLGDPAKVDCGTCHRDETKPLGGYDLLSHYVAGLTEDGRLPTPSPDQQAIIDAAKPISVTGAPEQQPVPSPAPVSELAIRQTVQSQGRGSGPVPSGTAPQNAQTGSGSGQQGTQQVAPPPGGTTTPAPGTPDGSGNSNPASAAGRIPGLVPQAATPPQPTASGDDAADGSGIKPIYRSEQNPNPTVPDLTLGGTVQPLAPTAEPSSPPGFYPTGKDAPQNSDPQQLRPGTTVVRNGGVNEAPSLGKPSTGDHPQVRSDDNSPKEFFKGSANGSPANGSSSMNQPGSATRPAPQ